MFRQTVSICLLCLSLLVGTATAQDYVFILKARGNPYWQAVVDGISETAKANNTSVAIHQLQNDSAAEEQLNVCEAVLAQKPKVLAISSVTPAVGVQCMRKASALGVIVADMDANVLPDDAAKAGFDLAFSVGSNNFLIGEEAAKFVAESQSGEGLQVLVLEGAAGSIPGKHRADGFRTKLSQLLPKAQIVASISADWDRLKAMTITADLLQRSPQMNLIYAANDLMALGAAEAVRAAGRADSIKIVGVDGTADARKAVQEGRLAATVAQLPYLIGKRAVEKAMAVRAGQQTEKHEITPTPVLTAAVLKDTSNPVLQYVR